MGRPSKVIIDAQGSRKRMVSIVEIATRRGFRRGYVDYKNGFGFSSEYDSFPKGVQWDYEHGRLMAAHPLTAGLNPYVSNGGRGVAPLSVEAAHVFSNIIWQGGT